MSSVPLPFGFVASADPRVNLVTCTVCGTHMPRAPQNLQEHLASNKHRTALAQQQQPSQHVAAAAAAVAPSSVPLSTDGGLGDSELELQLLAQKHKYALEKIRMEQEMEQMKLRQRILEKQQAEEEAAIIARLAQLKMHTQTQTSTPTQASKAGAGMTSPPGFTQPRAAATAASSLSLTPNPAPRVYAPTAPASAPAARPPASSSAAAPTVKSALASASPSVDRKPGLLPHPAMVGVLTKWKGKIFGVIEVPADQAIDGQTIFQFHINQLMPGVDRAQLTVGSHAEFRIWVNAERRLFANCVQPAGEEGRAARVSAKAEAPMGPGSSQPSDDEDDGQSDRSGEEGAAPFTTVTHRKHAAASAAAASPSASSSAVSSSKLAPGTYDRMIGQLQSFAPPRGLILLPADKSINGTREVCVHTSQLLGTITAGTTVSFQLFVNAALKLFANEVRPVAQTAAAAAAPPPAGQNGLWELEVILRDAMHRSSAPAFLTSVLAQSVRQKFPYVADKLYPSNWLALWQLADSVGLVVLETRYNEHGGQHYWLKPLFDKASPMRFHGPSKADQREDNFTQNGSPASNGHGAGVGVGAALTPLSTPVRVVHKTLAPGGPASPDPSPVRASAGVSAPFAVPSAGLAANPAFNELAEVRAALEALGGDVIDVSPVAMQIMKRNPGFKERLGDGGWMPLWKRAHAAGVATLESRVGSTGITHYSLRLTRGSSQQLQSPGAAAAAPHTSEFSEIQSALASMATQTGGELFDQASVAEWMGRRNPQLKAQLAGGGWMALFKRADAAGAVKMESRVGPRGATHYSLRLTRGPQIQAQGAASAAATPQRAESSPATSSQASASTVPASPAVGSSSEGGLSDLEQFHLRKQQRLDDLRRAQEELEREEQELRQRQSTQQTSMDETDEEAEARRVEQEQAEIEAAFAELSSPPEAPVASAAPLTQWTSLASSLASQPIASMPVAAASSSSSSSSSAPVPAGLLRGTFLLWYDHMYGTLLCEGRELLVHADQIYCETSDLTRGCAVQFVLHRGKDRDYAEAVQPLGWSPTRGLEPGHCRGVIARWVDATHGLLRARVHGLQREQILFHVDQCGSLSAADLAEHTKVTFKPVVNPHNGKTFAHEVRLIKPANSAAQQHNEEEDDNEQEDR